MLVTKIKANPFGLKDELGTIGTKAQGIVKGAQIFPCFWRPSEAKVSRQDGGISFFAPQGGGILPYSTCAHFWNITLIISSNKITHRGSRQRALNALNLIMTGEDIDARGMNSSMVKVNASRTLKIKDFRGAPVPVRVIRIVP